MSLERIIRKAWSENLLFSVLVELTYRCNLDCYFCYNDLGLRGVPLTRDEYTRFFEDLRDMQVLHLALTGGEPLTHPDFMFIGRKTKDLGFVVRVKSNGHAIHGELARRLKEEVAPYVVEVSLHGASAETHDRQTRVPGSFVRLLRNVEGMLRAGLRVKLNSTLTAYNETEIEGMFAIADGFGVTLQFDPEVTARDDGDRSVLDISASRDGLKRLFRLGRERASSGVNRGSTEVARQADDLMSPPSTPHGPHGPPGPPGPPGGKHCGAGSSGVAVDPYGNVYPCVQWRRPAGNLHERSIKEIWRSSATLDEVRELTVAAGRVVSAYSSPTVKLAFCPGSAEANTGSPLTVHAEALLRLEVAQSVEDETKTIHLPVLPN